MNINKEKLNLNAALDQASENIIMTDEMGVIQYVNKSFENNTGFCHHEIVDKHVRSLTSGYHLSNFYTALLKGLASEKEYRGVIINKTKSGVSYAEDISVKSIRDESNNVVGYISVGRMFEHDRLKHDFQDYELLHDSLTGLPNRIKITDILELYLLEAKNTKKIIAVIYIDVDDFKLINESLGHKCGDYLLKEISNRLSFVMRGSDYLSRIGGDHFLAVCIDLYSHDQVIEITNRINDVFSKPFNINDREIYVSACIGVSVYPNDTYSGESLLKNSDAASSWAKKKGKNNIHYYTHELDEKANNRIDRETQLRKAIANNGLFLEYQPIFDSTTKSIVGAEALLRCRISSTEVLPPNEFIPILEDSGMILEVGEWIIEKSCEQCLSLMNNDASPFYISINVSPKQFEESNFEQQLFDLLDKKNIDYSTVQLEVTETALFEDYDNTIKVLSNIRKKGIRIAIDDFGTGYCSLGYLKNLPIDVVKIDRLFVKEVGDSNKDNAIVNAIIDMSHTLGLKVIAEGIETNKQLKVLQNAGCDAFQGFLLSRPIPVEEFLRLAKTHANTEQKLTDCDSKKIYRIKCN